MVAVLDRLGNEVRKRRAVTVLFDQDIIEAGVSAKWPYNVMRIARKTETAQIMQVVEFPLHMTKSNLLRKIWNTTKKFSDNPDLAVLVFVEIDMV